MAKANMKELHNLHGAIAKFYIEAAESGEDLSSGTLAAINAFLKNNDITVDVIESSPGQDMTNKLKLLIMNDKEETG